MAIKTPQKKVPKKAPVKISTAPKKPVVKKTAPVSSGSGDAQKILDTHSRHLEKIDNNLSRMSRELKELKDVIVAVKTSLPATQPGPAGKKIVDSSWHPLIEPNREYTQKEIIGITKISQPTLSMAKVRGHIVTKEQPGKRGWVVLGSELIRWDKGRARNAPKKSVKTTKPAPASKKPVSPSKKAATKPVKSAAVSKPAPKALAVSPSAKTGKKVAVPKKETKALTVQSSAKAVKTSTAAKKPMKPVVAAKSTRVVKKAPVKKTGSDIHSPIPNDIPGRISALTMKKVVTQTQFGHDVGLPQKVIYEITTRKRKELNPSTIQKINATLKKYESK
jgi:hypothetical protein